MVKEIIITEAIDKWMESEHYHHPLKGCKMKHKGTDARGDGLSVYHCDTCKVDTSRGGWEWGWFGGTLSKLIKD